MKKLINVVCLIFSLVKILFVTGFAGETGHYTNGVEGIKAASLPPPGFYWKVYNAFYSANKLTDQNGDELDLGLKVNVYAMVNRFVWISKIKILGADYAADILIPTIYTDFKLEKIGLEDNDFGLGDIIIEPFILSWHKPQYDLAGGLSLVIPTGKYDITKPASPGKNFWTGLFTLGGTYYFDKNRTWSASILARYEIHTEKKETAVKPGNDFQFEWGIGKTVAKIWDVGLTGYCHWQVTDDSGADVVWDKSVHDRVFGIGPEVSIFLPPKKLMFSLRSQMEFGAIDRSVGNITTLNMTKIF